MESTKNISHEFFKKCEEIELGKLVAVENFSLIEAMSVIELMDPKMDSGMVRMKQHTNLEELIVQGLYNDNLQRQIATIDATFALLVAWLEGASLPTTVWTNVLIANSEDVSHDVYGPFAQSFIHIIKIVTHIIQNSCTFEEEDFNCHVPFHVITSTPREVAVRQLREVIAKLAKESQTITATAGETDQSKHLLAIGARLEMCCLFIEVLTWLAPSPRDDSEAKKKKKKGKKGKRVEDEEEEEYEEEDVVMFQPQFPQAQASSKRLEKVSYAIAETVNMGQAAPDGVDGNFDWLLAIEPDLNRAHLPVTFPRKIVVPDRKTALNYITKLAKRIHHICETVPTATNDLTSLFYFARSFNLDNSCVLTRSLVQLVIFPVDEHIFGDMSRTMAEPLTISLRDNFAPLVLQKGSPAYQDPICVKLLEYFISAMTKVALNVFQLFGCNLARQRDRLVTAISQMGNCRIQANQIEIRTEELMRKLNSCELFKFVDAPHHSCSTFVFNNLIALITHYFELSLRMDLFVPYEFTYIYWYMGDILARWQIGTMERSQEMQMAGWKNNPLSNSSNRRSRERAKGEEALRKRLQVNQYQMIQQYGICQLCEGIVKLSIILMRMAKIKVPAWSVDSEKIRYEARMAPFKPLGSPLYINYEQYKNLSSVEEHFRSPPEPLMEQTIEHFQSAILHFEKILDKPEVQEDSATYLKVAKTNLVGSRLMSNRDVSSRKVEWIFLDECPIFPILKIS
ncbi:unnamed protein product [Caenorhabditis bovis]|uniref:Protein MAK10 homolog n=1 Tax=Caenorhabditis bovis TaxID=2654633 RepID=A0A8S1EHG1_9PELO|nr:unnamed protein product [Caenorhabditis bovis]